MVEIATGEDSSLRSLRIGLFTIGAGAALLWTWLALRLDLFLTAAFVVASLLPLLWCERTWRYSHLISWAALYFPFAAMASYTLFFVPCDHCKHTVWALFPYGPGLLPVWFALKLLHLPRPNDAVWFLLTLGVSIAMLIAMMVMIQHRGRLLKTIIVAVAAVYSSFAAAAVLGMTRM